MTLNSPEIQLRLAEWQDELREATGKPELILMAYEPLRVDVVNGKLPLESIIQMVCEETGIELSEVLSRTKKREVVIARQLICYFSKTHTGLSLKKIGEALGGRDHTTVIHSCQTIEDLLDTKDRAICAPVASISRRIEQNKIHV